jgi:DNA helicase-2/ATP-dependent DNA helicase PcrA
VKGSIDRIERTPDGEYAGVDFKTGSKLSSITKNSVLSDTQLNLSCLAIKEMFLETPAAGIVQLYQRHQDGRLFPD